MSNVSPSRSWKVLSLVLVASTLVIGILIGTVLNTGVEAQPARAGASDATPLTIPDPVELSNEFTKLAQDIEPAVVFIQSDYEPEPQTGSRAQPGDEMERFWRYFGGPLEEMPQPRRSTASGSGFLVDPKGYIITNNHVVEGADEINVRLVEDQTEHKAKVIGVDTETDLAVIKIDSAKPLPFARIGNSDAVQVGDWAVAIGSPFGLEASVTAGIVSAKGRDDLQGSQQFQSFIQTDAAINPGNSGGPLLNIRGEVIGINTMIATRNGAYQGVGFALPINTAAKVYNMIIESGRVTRGSIGISFGRDNSKELLEAFGLDHGVSVSAVEPGGPAEKAGIREQDVILAMDGTDIRDGDDLVARVADTPPGQKVVLIVDRDGKRIEIPVTIEDREKVFAGRFGRPPQGPEPSPAESTEAKFGIVIQRLTMQDRDELGWEDEGGVVITQVEPRSFAEDIGLAPRDVIVSINRRPVASIEDVQRIQQSISPGDAVAFFVRRPLQDPSGRITLNSLYLAGRLP